MHTRPGRKFRLASFNVVEDGSAQGDSDDGKHTHYLRTSSPICANGNNLVLSRWQRLLLDSQLAADQATLQERLIRNGQHLVLLQQRVTPMVTSLPPPHSLMPIDTASDLGYANAYYGVGGDMLVVDSKPDAIRGGGAIAMDITYTGPSGSCSVEEVTKGSKESAVCSNRGVCDYETGTCVCAEGFMKEACSEQSVLV